VRKYVGDYTLFMSGLFRRFVERGGYLNYYLEEGARSYRDGIWNLMFRFTILAS